MKIKRIPVILAAALVCFAFATQSRGDQDNQGTNRKFDLFGVAVDTQDPNNSANDVVGINTNTAPNFGGASLKLLEKGLKVEDLTDELSLKYLFQGSRSCSCGAPRISLLIDPGNGNPAAEIFGYVGTAPFGVGCTTGSWTFQDLTDNVGRWDLSKFGGSMTSTWSQVVTFFDTGFPNHEVEKGFLDDDGCAGCGVSASNPACGQAFYDLVTIDNSTWQNDQDNTRPEQ